MEDKTMTKYRRKPVEVEAFQMTRERRWDNSEWPGWLNEAWNKDPSDFGCLCCLDAYGFIGPGEDLCLITSKGRQFVVFDDWILRDAGGELSVCHSNIFKENYDPV